MVRTGHYDTAAGQTHLQSYSTRPDMKLAHHTARLANDTRVVSPFQSEPAALASRWAGEGEGSTGCSPAYSPCLFLSLSLLRSMCRPAYSSAASLRLLGLILLQNVCISLPL